jgi:hypothetical protein
MNSMFYNILLHGMAFWTITVLQGNEMTLFSLSNLLLWQGSFEEMNNFFLNAIVYAVTYMYKNTF